MTAVPATFGKYFLTGKLATGGMAEIYLAKLIGPGGFEKHLVIKQIHPQFSRDRQFLELFVAEAKTLVSLSHGNIVPIYELGVVEDTYFIAMEYIDGPTQERFGRELAKRDETLSPELATYITAEILKGLDYAHRKDDGVIHRDLSSRNVMLSREGGVKLVDFGLAVHTEGHQLTKGAGGRPAGSFPYMSPEQVRGEKLDPRSDLFSTGVLLWEMLTGESLFARPDPDETLAAVTEAEIPIPSERNPQVPAALDTICMTALERDRDERYPNAAQFLRPLTRFLYSSDHTVGAAELSRLITRCCPPSGRQLVGAAARDTDGDATAPHDADDSKPPSSNQPEDGKHLTGTVVMAGRTEAKGKRRRADTVTTFATNAVWGEALREAGAAAVETAPATKTRPASGDEPVGEMTSSAGVARDPMGTGRGWAAAAIVLALIAGFSVAMWWRAAPVSQANNASDRLDASTPSPPIDARVAVVAPDAAQLAKVADAAPEPDAKVIVRRRRDAGGKVVPIGKATLIVGANPWADVTVDGRKVGRAPNRFAISAGEHKVVATFKGQRKTWTIKVVDGGSRSLFVDFTKLE